MRHSSPIAAKKSHEDPARAPLSEIFELRWHDQCSLNSKRRLGKMNFENALKNTGRLLMGVPLVLSVLTIVYGVIFIPPLVAVGFVALMTFAIVNIPLYLSESLQELPKIEPQKKASVDAPARLLPVRSARLLLTSERGSPN